MSFLETIKCTKLIAEIEVVRVLEGALLKSPQSIDITYSTNYDSMIYKTRL